MWPIQNIGSRE